MELPGHLKVACKQYNLIDDKLRLVMSGYTDDFSRQRNEGFTLILLQANPIAQNITRPLMRSNYQSLGYLGYEISEPSFWSHSVSTICNLDDENFFYAPGLQILNQEHPSASCGFERIVVFNESRDSFESRKGDIDKNISDLLIDVKMGKIKEGHIVTNEIASYLHHLFKEK